MILGNSSAKFKRTIKNIALGAYLYGISIGMNYVIIPLFLHDHNLSKSEIGIILSAEIFATFFVAPILPKAIAKFSMAPIFFVSLIIRNIVILIFPLLNGFYEWSSIYFIYGFGAVTVFISFQLWVNNICANESRATSMSIMTASIALGIASGPVILNLIGRTGYIAFAVSALFSLLTLIPLYLARHDTPQIKGESSLKFKEIIQKAKIPILGGMVGELTFITLMSYIVLFAISHGVEEKIASMLIASMLLGSIILDIPFGIMIDRFNKKFMLIICGISMLALSQTLPYFINDFKIASILLILWFASMSGIFIASLALIGEAFKAKDLVKTNSLFGFMNCGGGIIAMLICGRSMDYFGPDGLIYALGLIYTSYITCNIFFIMKGK